MGAFNVFFVLATVVIAIMGAVFADSKCEGIKNESSCLSYSSESCSWCTSGAVGASCMSAADAAGLPSSVFTCTTNTPRLKAAPVLQVDTTGGAMLGHMVGSTRVWKGIPYAKPPQGDLRWEYPQAPEPMSTVYEANVNVAGCPQDCKLPPGNCPAYGTSEDCLYLTVMAPETPAADGKGYPVLFWIHGGAYEQGLGNSPLYDGSTFAQKDVVTVVINYRIGALGFMASEGMTGNYGIMDQRLAMQWTKDNIKAFGGNPDRVTIAGQSAGAMSVGVHLTSPGSKGLYAGAIMESNCLGMPFHTTKSAATNADAAFEYLKCAKGDIACMKGKTPAEILDAQANSVKIDRKTLFINFLPFAPLVDGTVLPKQPFDALTAGEVANVPIMSGSLYDEGTMFVDELFTSSMSKSKYHTTVDAIFGLGKAKKIKNMYPMVSDDGRDAFAGLATDLIFYCPLRNVTRGISNNLGANVMAQYNYRFSHVLSFDCWGPDYSFCVGKVCHGSELPFVFNVFSDGSTFNYNPTAAETQLAQDMSSSWANFVTSGNPNQGLKVPETYPLYDPASRPLVVLNEPDFSDVTDPREEQCAMWDSMGYFY